MEYDISWSKVKSICKIEVTLELKTEPSFVAIEVRIVSKKLKHNYVVRMIPESFWVNKELVMENIIRNYIKNSSINLIFGEIEIDDFSELKKYFAGN